MTKFNIKFNRWDIAWIIPIFILICLASCTARIPVKSSEYNRVPTEDNFIVAKVLEQDSFSSLADRYLKDPSKGWLIAEFNDIETLTPGMDVIIPKGHFQFGGLKPNGFQTVTVLLYHGLAKDKSRNKMIVTEAMFEAQMKYLKTNGYHPLTMKEFLDFLDFKEQIPPKSILITFDDGWKSQYDIAIPILKKYGFPATLFIYTDFIGNKASLSWDEIRELLEKGFDIQCHSKTHRDLTEFEKNQPVKSYIADMEKEMVASKNLIKQQVNTECTCLAYPYGETNNLVVALLKKYGYRAGFTVMRGGNPFFINNYMIHRSAIYSDHSIEDFKKTLAVFHEKDLK